MTGSRTIAIIQARMSSTRLPGKVLLDINAKPMLAWVIERTRRARTLDNVAIATTTAGEDDPIAEYCRSNDYHFFRGSAYDVLDRYYQAAKQFRADIIVRLTADCPLIDPHEIDHLVKEFLRSGADFAANRLPPPWKRTYPIGLDTEVCTFTALERAWKEARETHQREHVMPYLYEKAGRFKVHLINHNPDYGSMRLTVDTAEDLAFIRQVCSRFEGRDDFSWYEVVDLLNKEPQLAAINANVQHKTLKDVDGRMNH